MKTKIILALVLSSCVAPQVIPTPEIPLVSVEFLEGEPSELDVCHFAVRGKYTEGKCISMETLKKEMRKDKSSNMVTR